jgi:O-antigen/teichoic acid export membrane protein
MSSSTQEAKASTGDRMSWVVAKNASSNVIRLIGAGVVAVLLPPFLVRMLPRETFGTWVLLLQITAYVGYLDFGISTAVSRFVAHAEEVGDFQQRDGVVSTAFALLSMAAMLSAGIILVLVWRMPEIFRQMPGNLIQDARGAFLLMGCSFVVGLPVSVLTALFIGKQRNEIPAAIAVGNKLLMGALVVLVVLEHRGLTLMGLALAVANILSYFAAILAWRKYAAAVKIKLKLASKLWTKQIAEYSGTLLVWMVGMLLVSGLDLSIVGIFDYKATAYYGVAATLTNFLAQVQGAIFAALLPASAVLGARGDGERLGSMLVVATRYGMLILLAMALPLIVAGHGILAVWVGKDYAQHSTAILQVLVVANVIRLCALPYATMLLGTGQQKKVILSPLAEGITNLIASVIGAYLIGAIGVAVGTLIGALVSVGLHVFYNMPRTSLIVIDRLMLVKQGLLRPSFCVAPFLLLFFLKPTSDLAGYVLLLTIATITTAILFWNFGLRHADRERLAHAIRSCTS